MIFWELAHVLIYLLHSVCWVIILFQLLGFSGEKNLYDAMVEVGRQDVGMEKQTEIMEKYGFSLTFSILA